MKTILILLSVSFFLFSCEDIKPKVPEIIISGEIKNFNDSSIKLLQNNVEYEISINNEGKFVDTIYDFKDGYFKIVLGKEYSDMYLKDGSDVSFTVDANQFDETLKYNGIGANENNFLAQRVLQNADFSHWDFSLNEEGIFVSKVDSFIAFKHKSLEEYKTVVPEIDENFYQLEKMNTSYYGAYLKEMYEFTHKYFTKKDSFDVSENFYSFRKNITLENKNALNTEYYQSYIEKYIENNIAKNDTSEDAFEALRIINRQFQDNELKKEFIYRSAQKYLKDVKKLDEYWALVSYMVTDKPKLKELKKDYKKLKKIQQNEPSPLTSIKNKDDEEFSLAEFKGEIVYIDMWAQWCAPCKAEAPFFKELEEKYSENEITFLKISLDKDKEAWKNYIVDQNEIENSFIIENAFDSEFAKSYMINTIPRFILLNKDLKIIDSNAKRPSNKELQTQLDKLLNV